jgi:hypothetical protein
MMYIKDKSPYVRMSRHTKHERSHVAMCLFHDMLTIECNHTFFDCFISDDYLVCRHKHDKHKFYCASMNALFHTSQTFSSYLRYYRTDQSMHVNAERAVVLYPDMWQLMANVVFYWPVIVFERYIKHMLHM